MKAPCTYYSESITWAGEAELKAGSSFFEALGMARVKVRVYGKVYPQPRYTKWYGPKPYAYSGQELPQADMPTWIHDIATQISNLTGENYNSVLLNGYVDGGDKVGWHADDEPLFDQGSIASVSFGACRDFRVRPKDKSSKPETFSLESGSLLLMKAGMQQAWEHEVPKRAKVFEPRLNLTFRNVSL